MIPCAYYISAQIAKTGRKVSHWCWERWSENNRITKQDFFILPASWRHAFSPARLLQTWVGEEKGGRASFGTLTRYLTDNERWSERGREAKKKKAKSFILHKLEGKRELRGSSLSKLRANFFHIPIRIFSIDLEPAKADINGLTRR